MLDQPFADHCHHGGQLYSHIGHDFSELDRAHEVIAADVLDAWYPPSPRVLALLKENLAWGCRTSPPARGEGLKDLIARKFSLPLDRIIIGNGSSDLIFRLLPFIFQAEEPVVIPAPSYGEYGHVVEKICQKSVSYFSTYETGLSVDVDKLLSHMERVKASGLVLINPCNPTGQYLTHHQIQMILERTAHRLPVLIDETYFAYMPPEYSAQIEIDRYEHLWIFRSLSKIYALSGLRVGYAVVPKKQARHMDLITPTYTVPTLAQVAAMTALLDDDYALTMVEETCNRREHLRQELLRIDGLDVPPSHINSLLLDLKNTGWRACDLQRRLRERGLLVRDIAGQGHQESDRYLRLAVLDYPTNVRSLEIVREALSAS